MHAVVVRVTISDREQAEQGLRDEIVPRVSKAPGLVSAFWTYKDGNGLSMAVFESEEAARGMEQMVKSGMPDAVTLEGVEVREVVAQT